MPLVPTPQITVVVPVYNRGFAVEATIDSALAQDLPREEVEVVVVDDGSTDETWTVLQELYGNNERVRLFSIPNGGVAKARNYGLEQARGEFIAFLDHDDLWLPSKLRLQCEKMKNPRVGVVYCQWRDIDENGIEVGDGNSTTDAYLPEGQVFEVLWRFNFIVSMSVPLLRTALVKQVGGFRSAYVPCDDLDLWFRLAPLCDFAVVRESLVLYRRHPHQQSSDDTRMVRATVRILKQHLRRNRKFALTHPKLLWHATTLAAFYKTRPQYDEAKNAVSLANWTQVSSCIKRAWVRAPFLLFIPQWTYIFKRLLTRDSRPF